MPNCSKIACGIFIGIVGLLLVIGSVLIGLAYSGHIWSETTGILDFDQCLLSSISLLFHYFSNCGWFEV